MHLNFVVKHFLPNNVTRVEWANNR